MISRKLIIVRLGSVIDLYCSAVINIIDYRINVIYDIVALTPNKRSFARSIKVIITGNVSACLAVEITKDIGAAFQIIVDSSLLLSEFVFSSSFNFVQKEIGCLVINEVNFVRCVSKALEPVDCEGGLHVLLLMKFSCYNTEVNCAAEDRGEINGTCRIVLLGGSSHDISGTKAVLSDEKRHVRRNNSHYEQCT